MVFSVVPSRPMIEMVIPSVLDKTLAPEGAHVCLLFTQYTPYDPPAGWGEAAKEDYATKVSFTPFPLFSLSREGAIDTPG